MDGPRPFQAVIFDLDGTLIDNEGIYDRAFCAVLKKRRISCEEVVHIPGIGVKENWEKMIERIGMKEDPQALADETQEFYLDHLGEVRVRSGVRELMYYLKFKKISRILATSNTSDIGTRVIGTLGIAHHFDLAVFGDEVPRKKPAPDLFLKAIQVRKLDPRSVIIVEDAPSGVEAAKAAGARVVAIKTEWATRSQLARADEIVDGFPQLLKVIKEGRV